MLSSKDRNQFALPANDRSLFRRLLLLALAAFLLTKSMTTAAVPPGETPDAGWKVEVQPAPARARSLGKTAVGLPVTTAADREEPVADAPPEAILSSGGQEAPLSPGASVTRFVEDDWTVTIIPGTVKGPVKVNGMTYEEVYRSVPYKKAEYYANPGYRHEATMEILFATLRPKTVVNQYESKLVPTPQFSQYRPYRYYSQRELNWGYRQGFPAVYGWGFPLYPRYPTYSQLW